MFCIRSIRTLIPFKMTKKAIKLLFPRPRNILQKETAMVMQLSNFSNMQEDDSAVTLKIISVR